MKIETALSGDGFDHGDGQVETLELRSLLDVKFQIPQNIAAQLSLGCARRVEAERADRLGDGAAVRVAAGEKIGVERPTSARLPMNGTPKRTPSSSENATTSMPNSKRRPRSSSISARASTTPSTPS